MAERGKQVVIGIGSHHGDDQAGWQVVEGLERHGPPSVLFRKVATPIDLIEWLDHGAGVHLVDAAAGLDTPVQRLRYACPDDRERIASLPPNGTHGFSVDRALKLAESLERPTDHVQLWLCAGESFLPFAEITERADQAIRQCVKLLCRELCSSQRSD
jgi:hydrogenase maturation protease